VCARELQLEVVLRPRLLVDGLNLRQCLAQFAERARHLLRIAARGELRLFEQSESAREVVNNFLASGHELGLAAVEKEKPAAKPLAERSFLELCRFGFALTWPMAAIGLMILLVLLLKR
jgi:hypothetical protein